MIIKIPDEIIDLKWGGYDRREVYINTDFIVSIDCNVYISETWNTIEEKINKDDFQKHYNISIVMTNGTIYGITTLLEPEFNKVLSWLNMAKIVKNI